MSIKAEYLVNQSSLFWQDMPIFFNFSQKYKNEQNFLCSYCTKTFHICTQCSHIQCTSKAAHQRSDIPIGFEMTVQQ